MDHHWLVLVYLIALFFVLTPGVLVTLPPGQSKLVVALFHALVFGLVWKLTNRFVSSMAMKMKM